ncbi:TraR/DksA family transcriptional regulator [Streptomyces sp. NPDC050560]|uniref:TraR/DksA family transcriptional regulator n=1 Tax=Streptomyces sp. NPDC050560 TaxID=3365630 RepID=UPI0037A7E725
MSGFDRGSGRAPRAGDGAAPVPGDGGGSGRLDDAAVRARLGAEREDAAARIAALGRDFDAIVAANALVAVDDEHDPEGSSTAFERAHVAAMLRQAREYADEIDAALDRLDRGAYGRCADCGRDIPAARLLARPASRTCVSCVS